MNKACERNVLVLGGYRPRNARIENTISPDTESPLRSHPVKRAGKGDHYRTPKTTREKRTAKVSQGEGWGGGQKGRKDIGKEKVKR